MLACGGGGPSAAATVIFALATYSESTHDLDPRFMPPSFRAAQSIEQAENADGVPVELRLGAVLLDGFDAATAERGMLGALAHVRFPMPAALAFLALSPFDPDFNSLGIATNSHRRDI